MTRICQRLIAVLRVLTARGAFYLTHRHATRLRLLSFFLVCSPCIALADYVEVVRTAKVYSDANSQSTVIQSIDPATEDHPIYFAVIDAERTNGYFHVRLPSGADAWVYVTRVRHYEGNAPGTQAAATGSSYGGIPNDTALHDNIKHLTNIGYAVGYSETKLDPLWAAFRIPATHGAAGCKRLQRFKTDDRTDAKVTHDAYNGAGYDRGHMANSSTIGAAYGCEAQNETYFMSNITPQLPSLNQKAWGGLEDEITDEYAEKFGVVWVITGPIFDREWAQELCSGVEIPTAFYKIVVREVNGRPDALAVIMKQDTRPGTPIRDLVTTIDEIEHETDIDFFPNLPASVQGPLESTRATDAAWELDKRLDTAFPGASRPTCVSEKHRRTEEVDR